MKEIPGIVYVADDGKQFLNKHQCELHEENLAQYTYWAVNHNPDLTEGRGFYQTTYLKVKCRFKHATESLLIDHCFNTYGNKTSFVMGVSPTPNWILFKSTAEKFQKAEKPRVGDYHHKAVQITLHFDEKEKNFVEIEDGNEN